MSFKEVESANIPAFSVFADRLKAADPLLNFVKAGRDFDSSIIRIYIKLPNGSRFAVDIPCNLMDDLESCTKNGQYGNARELVSQLDAIIKSAIQIDGLR